MRRATILLAMLLGGCGDRDTAPVDAAPDASPDGPPGCDGACAGEGAACGSSPADLDAGALPCAPGLVCCYPCGIPDCVDRCTTPCDPGGGACQENGCPGPFP